MESLFLARRAMFAAVAVFVFCAGVRADDAEKTATYSPAKAGFKIEAPVAWKPQQNSNPQVAVALIADHPPDTYPSVFAIVIPGSELRDSDLALAMKGVHDGILEEDPAAVVSEPEEVTLDGSKSLRNSYTRTKNGFKLKGFNIASIRHGKLYLVSYYADLSVFSSKLAEVEKIVSSWKWTD